MKKHLLKMFSDYLEDIEYLNQEQKEMLMVLGLESERIVPFMYDCFCCLTHQMEKAELKENQLSFYVNGDCYLVWGKQEIVMDMKDAKELIVRFIDIFETVYPLGTVVELSEEFSESLKLKDHMKKVKVVIVERFASTKDKSAYFPYVGLVYPVGMLGRGKCIHFTSALIDSVVHMGYRDEMDDAYILLMKKELILDNDAMSFGFLKKEQIEAYGEELGGMENGKERD